MPTSEPIVTVINDDDGVQKWSSIEETHVDGILTKKVVNYDDGSHRTEERTDGVVTRVFLEDMPTDAAGHIQSWSTQEQVFSAGVLTQKTIVYDDITVTDASTGAVTVYDGRTVVKDYTDGVLTANSTYDVATGAPGNQPYTSWVQTYQAGNQTGETFVNDDGSTDSEVFVTEDVLDSNGDPVVIEGETETVTYVQSKSQIDATDVRTFNTGEVDEYSVVGAQNWSTIDTTYNSNEDITSVDTLGDNGIRQVQTYTDGVLSQTDITDESTGGLAVAWSMITKAYSAITGLVTSKVTTKDDGATVSVSYEAGTETITDKTIVNANGTTVEVAFSADGDRTSWSITDVTDVDPLDGSVGTATYSSISKTYRDDGSVAEAVKTDDLGVVTTKSLDAAGKVTSVSGDDNSVGGTAQAWDSFTNTFVDEIRTASTINYDNGIVSTKTYDALGNVATVQLADIADVKGFDTIDTTYNAGGAITGQVVTKDDGRVDTKTLDATTGNQIKSVVTDVDNVKAYSSITTDYDDNGSFEMRTMEMDTGETIQKTFYAPTGDAVHGGGKTQIWVDGTQDQFEWSSKQRDFAEDGQVTKTDIVYDDRDRVIKTFDAGDPEFKILIDGAEDNAHYLYRVTAWDESGVATQTDYADMPDDAALQLLINGDIPMI